MSTEQIRELEARHLESTVRYRLSEAKHRNTEATINAAVRVVVAQYNFHLMALFYSAMRAAE